MTVDGWIKLMREEETGGSDLLLAQYLKALRVNQCIVIQLEKVITMR